MARKQQSSHTRAISGIAGGILLAIGCLWLGWMLVHGNAPNVASLTIPGLGPTPAPEVQVPPLLAEGITLGHASQQPALSQQQALLLAGQLEPAAAASAKNVSARYVLLTYPDISTPATHSDLSNVPVWMVWYQQIPLQPADASVDPTPFPQSSHDLYVFLDANSGKELLSIWA